MEKASTFYQQAKRQSRGCPRSTLLRHEFAAMSRRDRRHGGLLLWFQRLSLRSITSWQLGHLRLHDIVRRVTRPSHRLPRNSLPADAAARSFRSLRIGRVMLWTGTHLPTTNTTHARAHPATNPRLHARMHARTPSPPSNAIAPPAIQGHGANMGATAAGMVWPDAMPLVRKDAVPQSPASTA